MYGKLEKGIVKQQCLEKSGNVIEYVESNCLRKNTDVVAIVARKEKYMEI